MRAIVVALGALLLSEVATAEERPRVRLQLDRCSRLSQPDIERILQAELGAKLVEWNGADVTTVSIRCRGAFLRMQVEDPVSRKRVDRNIDLSETARTSRDRLVALAASELVIASWSELEVNPHLEVEPAEPPAPPGAADAARGAVQERMTSEREMDERRRRRRSPPAASRIVGLGSVRGFVSYPGALWGGGVRFGQELFGVVSWSGDVLIEQGRLRRSEGEYHVSTATLGGTVAMFYQYRWLTLRAGVGLRVGIATSEPRFGGVSGSSSTVAPWGWPLLVTSASIRVYGSAVLELGLAGGYVLLPVSSGTTQVGEAAFRGSWLSGQLGVGFVL